MTFPHIWLAKNNIKKFKFMNITQYLILEGLDSIGQATLLVDTEISTLDEPLDVVWLWVWHCRQL
jgi:hypothetical protein